MITKRVSFPNSTLDDALWAAYRRYDKTAVTKKLFYRLFARGGACEISAYGQRPIKFRRLNGCQPKFSEKEQR
jgi:hypothetical protein